MRLRVDSPAGVRARDVRQVGRRREPLLLPSRFGPPTDILSGMRRALFIAVLAVLLADASGVSSLLVPETCPIGTSDSAPDSSCPAFCVRCTCACCAASIEQSTPPDVAVAPAPPSALALLSLSALPTGSHADILHVPSSSLRSPRESVSVATTFGGEPCRIAGWLGSVSRVRLSVRRVRVHRRRR